MVKICSRQAILVGGSLLLVATATAAVAGNGVGGVFNLGQVNTVNAQTTLSGTVTTRQLSLSNASTAPASAALVGISNGGTGVVGQSTTRIGVRALAIGTTGATYGLFATTASANGLAGYFQNINGPQDFTGTALVAVSRGSAVNIPNNYADAAGEFIGFNGVLGTTSPGSDTGFGVIGDTAGPSAAGVRAAARSTTGANYGIWATTASDGGVAGFFQNSGNDTIVTGTALRAISEGSVTEINPGGVYYAAAGEFVGANGVIGAAALGVGDGNGVIGRSTASLGRGVFGDATNIGVYGKGDTYGLYSQGHAFVTGNLVVQGTVVKGSGTFRIDHPQDPANKYLSHSFVESPDMMNIYAGNIVTDAQARRSSSCRAISKR